MQSEIDRIAKKVCTESLGINPRENVLIISNPTKDLTKISESVYRASQSLGANPTLVYQPKKTQLDFMEDAVRHALMSNPNVIMSLSEDKLGKDKVGMSIPYRLGDREYQHYFNLLRGEKISRGIWTPTLTEDIFLRAVDVDYEKMDSHVKAIGRIMEGGDSIHITTEKGTDFRASIEGKKPHYDSGIFKTPGSGGNVPSGEVYISPKLETSNGVLAIDGVVSFLDGCAIPREPVEVYVEKGSISKVKGGADARNLEHTFEQAIKKSQDLGKPLNNKKVGEIGIGVNPKAAVIPNILEAEKAFRTCHVAFGSDYDNQIECLTHLDQIIREPTIEIERLGTTVYTLARNGELQL